MMGERRLDIIEIDKSPTDIKTSCECFLNSDLTGLLHNFLRVFLYLYSVL